MLHVSVKLLMSEYSSLILNILWQIYESECCGTNDHLTVTRWNLRLFAAFQINHVVILFLFHSTYIYYSIPYQDFHSEILLRLKNYRNANYKVPSHIRT